ncbi:hypothetical protein [Methanococcus maripaludis]|uniref:Uncharacterized protein n=1 Tax=Methanococcus maripaludis TaxID=39152 RepID=A0A7J9PP80_METMI|nr:hypothetical protein [Methanococcus maripaludis]MBA2864427.1 hypothetical protein [Methanococcus maripaludis]
MARGKINYSKDNSGTSAPDVEIRDNLAEVSNNLNYEIASLKQALYAFNSARSENDKQNVGYALQTALKNSLMWITYLAVALPDANVELTKEEKLYSVFTEVLSPDNALKYKIINEDGKQTQLLKVLLWAREVQSVLKRVRISKIDTLQDINSVDVDAMYENIIVKIFSKKVNEIADLLESGNITLEDAANDLRNIVSTQ